MTRTKQTKKNRKIEYDPSDTECIKYKTLEDLYKSLSDDILAQQFKTILHHAAKDNRKDIPSYDCSQVDGLEFKGFTASVKYDGMDYQCVGVMLNEFQAQQSAAEVCLRKIGELPSIADQDKYTIHAYKGGCVRRDEIRAEMEYNNAMPDLLRHRCAVHGFSYPQYRWKNVSEEKDAAKYIALLFFEGKLFVGTTPAGGAKEANRDIIMKALAYLGFQDLKEGIDLMGLLSVRQSREFMPIGSPYMSSPYHFCPSKRECWVSVHFEYSDGMTGEKYTDESFRITRERPLTLSLTWDAKEELMTRVFKVAPRIGDSIISDMEELYVSQINKELNTNFLVGDNNCSIPLFSEDGQIMCKSKGKKVDLMSGQRICKLKCSYEVRPFSLRAYLKAEECEDIVSDKGEHPILASCGAVLLMCDPHAKTKDIHVLLERPLIENTFKVKAIRLARYFNMLTRKQEQEYASFDVEDCVSDIAKWPSKEVELLSEMTVESMETLMGSCSKYYKSWNKIIKDENNEILKNLKAAAAVEASKRSDELEEVDARDWHLPNTPFKHRLTNTGILMENVMQCTFRSLQECTGLKVKINELENASTIDVPLTVDGDTHTGEVCRYHIWRGLRKVSGDSEGTYYSDSEVLSQFAGNWVPQPRARSTKRKLRKEQSLHKNSKQSKKDDTSDGIKVEAKEDDIVAIETSESAEVEGGGAHKRDAADKEDNAANVDTEDVRDQDDNLETITSDRDITYKHDPRRQMISSECKWFLLPEAVKICPTLVQLSENSIFQEEVRLLQE